MVWYLYLSETPVSHLDTEALDTPRKAASCSWVMPLLCRFSSKMELRFNSFMEVHLAFLIYKGIIGGEEGEDKGEKRNIC